MMQNTSLSLIVDGMEPLRVLNRNQKTLGSSEWIQMRKAPHWSRGGGKKAPNLSAASEHFGVNNLQRRQDGRLLPHKVEAGRMVQQLSWVTKQVIGIPIEEGQQAAFILWGPHDIWFARDPYTPCGIDQSGAKSSYFIDQAQWKGLFACPDLAGGERPDLVLRGVPSGRYIMDELPVHIVNQRLEVSLFLRCGIAAGVARVFQLSGMDDDTLELRPTH